MIQNVSIFENLSQKNGKTFQILVKFNNIFITFE